MDYPIRDMKEIDAKALGILTDADGNFSIAIKGYIHSLSEEELLSEMTDQLDVRNSVRNALLRKAQKTVLAGLKKGRLRLSEEELEVFDLNILIWFADKVLKGEHQAYLAK
ncbi:hypothetical protein [Sneathiella glossodoripedis]|uniref:hypothetical protein n=1 Tax=Sneathiella glossodoripedis TaxID=418853 RepID=UPI000470C865|nr:hypothetical protein [Sneathiella glossodoripedis]